jgi:signal transduction histidine kinase
MASQSGTSPHTLRHRLSAYSGVGSLSLSGLGALFLGSYLVYVTHHEAYRQGPGWLLPVGVFLVLVLGCGLLYGGYWLATSPLSAEHDWRILMWTFGGVVAAVAVTFWPIFYQRVVGVPVADPAFILLVSAGLGANAGAVAGVAQAQSRRQYDHVRQARESLAFLNRLLRHNVLNAIQIIQGNADLLVERSPDAATVDRARTIGRQSARIDTLVQNTRVLIRQMEGETATRDVDLSAVVEDEVETARETYPGATIETDIDPAVRVRADPLVPAVVNNLVDNAIRHNDRRSPRVTITLGTRNDAAILQVADDGPGLSDEARATLADPGRHGDYGMGLYLVDTLLDRYDGAVRFDENAPRGTVVTAELPLATPATE